MENDEMTDPKELEQKTEPYSLTVGMDPTALTGDPRPDLIGQRIRDPEWTIHGPGAIYLIDIWGKKRWIPDPETYNNLFRTWTGITSKHDLAIGIPEMIEIQKGAILARAAGDTAIWLITDMTKRLVLSPAVMDKYHFSWDRIYTLPPILIQSIAFGPSVT